MSIHSTRLSSEIKEQAHTLGLDACGIASASPLEAYVSPLKDWINAGYQGKMGYMANHFEKRIDPGLLLTDARSVVVVAQNYYPPRHQPETVRYRIARFAYGKDYHYILKEKLNTLAAWLSSVAGNHQFRVFVDTAPVLEKPWAVKAGLGQTGKNTCLIIPRKGSYYFLGELITSMELPVDPPFQKDLCGKCSRCMDACPTGAIVAPGEINASKCISYLTIELKENIPQELRQHCQGWVFGCDVCQEVCPHNKYSKPHQEPFLSPIEPVVQWPNDLWEACSKTAFNKAFKKTASPIARIKHEKLMDNISCARASCR